ncbi:response regulator transcription factor [Nocardia crassostreae]|uniref:response regulator transcription factor n=1 Tax=Nocardia crassostreae TaxID=53428 RepID=UPI0008353521|nr:helix-turn-helix transcriptional regulator [Nocardia crassostreae]
MRFLDRTQALDALLSAREDVAAGAATVVAVTIGGAPGLFVRTPEPTPPDAAAAARLPRLTARQRDVLDLVCAGLTNAEIADYLVLSIRTVDHHVSAILRKLNVRTRCDARALVLNQALPRQLGHPVRPRTALLHQNSHQSRIGPRSA